MKWYDSNLRFALVMFFGSVAFAAIFLGILVAVARAEPTDLGAACRYCHPIRCLTSQLCGSGCFCLKDGGASTGRCVNR